MVAAVIAGILACAGLLGILIFITTIPNFCPDINSFDAPMVGERWFLLIFILAVLLSWYLARNSSNMYTINESGTKLFGRTPTNAGYIATKWICVFFFPVLPVRSYEVLAKGDYGTQVQYVLNQQENLFWPQIATTALKSFLSFVGIYVAFTVLFNINCFITIR